MSRYFYVSLFCFLFVSCNQNPTQIEKEYIKNLEEKNRALEIELKDIKSRLDTNYNPLGTRQKNKLSKTYFTIGSTEDEVIQVMGDPTAYIDFGHKDKQFRYGESRVTFKNGKVESYHNVEGNLRVKVK